VVRIKNRKVTSYHNHYHPDEKSGICIVRRKDETSDELVRRFRKKYSKSGLAKEIRDRMFYEKPSDKRRRKKMQSIRQIQRDKEKLEEQQERYERFKQRKARQRSKNDRKENKHDSSSSGQNNSTSDEGIQDRRWAYSA
jgi:small subunit ribosomal protein S21